MPRLLSLATVAGAVFSCCAQATLDPFLTFRSHVERIEVLPEAAGFTRQVVAEGTVLNGTYPFAVISNGLERLDAFNGSYVDEEGRTVKLRDKDLRERSLITDVFYSDLKAHFVSIPPTTDVRLSWTTRCDDVMLLGALDLAPHQPAEELVYEVVVPHTHRLLSICPSTGVQALASATDSTSLPGMTVHRFRTTASQAVQGPRPYHGYPLVDARSGMQVRLAVVPAGAPDGFAAFEAWYTRLVAPVQQLDTATVAWVERTTAPYTAPRDKARVLFDEVKGRVAYVDLEDHLNAFRPRPPAQTWANKKGDCKDMANLLCQAYRHLGIDAHLAISSTLAHGVDLDFPSLGSGDHVICVARFGNGPWTYLDATEKECVFGMPSRQIQDRNILIIGDDGSPHHVPPVAADSNRCTTRLDLTLEGTALRGTMRTQSSGLAAVRLRSGAHGADRAVAERWLTERLECGSTALRASGLSTEEQEHGMELRATAEALHMVNTMEGRHYTSLKFLPFPHDLPRRVPEDARLVTSEAMYRELEAHIFLRPDMHLQPFGPVHVEAGGITFTLDVSEPEPGHVLIMSTYRCPYVTIGDAQRAAYEEVNQTIEKTLKRTIVHAIP